MRARGRQLIEEYVPNVATVAALEEADRGEGRVYDSPAAEVVKTI